MILITFNSTVTSGNINTAQAIFIEMFITAALCLSVLMLGAEKHQATPFAPVSSPPLCRTYSLVPYPDTTLRSA